MPAESWRALAATLELERHHPSRGSFELASELLPEDGPVAVLARDGAATLVRARDGTVGWVSAELGEACGPRAIPPPRAREDGGEAVLAAARSYLGVAYELGGTTRRRIDCSALVQRAYASALALVLPKNSNDQLAAFGGGATLEGPDPRARAGDLLFMHSRAEDRTHVGIASGAGTVVQASRSRSQVVEVLVADYLDDAHWLRRVRGEEILTWARTQVGRAHIDLPWR
jgi:cell wall-associated NlpC family hydrolase